MIQISHIELCEAFIFTANILSWIGEVHNFMANDILWQTSWVELWRFVNSMANTLNLNCEGSFFLWQKLLWVELWRFVHSTANTPSVNCEGILSMAKIIMSWTVEVWQFDGKYPEFELWRYSFYDKNHYELNCEVCQFDGKYPEFELWRYSFYGKNHYELNCGGLSIQWQIPWVLIVMEFFLWQK